VTFCYASFLPLIELSGKKWTFWLSENN
jgi:hypothetical protein